MPLFPKTKLSTLAFPVYYKIGDSVILFKTEKKCLRVTIAFDQVEITEEDTREWIDISINMGHKASQEDFAEALLKATYRIESYFNPKLVSSFPVTIYDTIQINE